MDFEKSPIVKHQEKHDPYKKGIMPVPVPFTEDEKMKKYVENSLRYNEICEKHRIKQHSDSSIISFRITK